MRVALVHSFYSSALPSGENAVVLDQAHALGRAGHEVRLIDRSTDAHRGDAAYRIRAAATTVTGIGPTPESALAEFNPEIVHLHNTFPNWGTRWLRNWSERTVATMHNFRPVCANGLLFRDGHSCNDCLRTPIIPAIRHRCYRNSAVASIPLGLGSSPMGGLRSIPRLAARVVALNEAAAGIYEAAYSRPVDVVPNFVVGSKSQMPTRRWIYVGRLSSEKGIDLLLRDWPEHEELDVIGDGPLRSELHHFASDSRVRMLGMLDREDVLSLLPQYRGLILPSMCPENLPTVILEALAAGVPLVLSQHIQAAQDMVRQGVAETFRPDAGVGEIRRALSSVDDRSEVMRAAARRVHDEKYSENSWLDSMNRIYTEVVAAAAATRK